MGEGLIREGADFALDGREEPGDVGLGQGVLPGARPVLDLDNQDGVNGGLAFVLAVRPPPGREVGPRLGGGPEHREIRGLGLARVVQRDGLFEQARRPHVFHVYIDGPVDPIGARDHRCKALGSSRDACDEGDGREPVFLGPLDKLLHDGVGLRPVLRLHHPPVRLVQEQVEAARPPGYRVRHGLPEREVPLVTARRGEGRSLPELLGVQEVHGPRREGFLIERGVHDDEVLGLQPRRAPQHLLPSLLIQLGLICDPQERGLRVRGVVLVSLDQPLDSGRRHDGFPGARGGREGHCLLLIVTLGVAASPPQVADKLLDGIGLKVFEDEVHRGRAVWIRKFWR